MLLRFLRKLLQKILCKIHGGKKAKGEVHLENKKFSAEKRCMFSSEQLLVIDAAVAKGYDISSFAKAKYSANQMKVLYYAEMLDIDSSDFNSFSMSPMEMEYHLYLATIDKYLGKGYLKHLLNNGKFSICDKKIKEMIDKALEQELGAYDEIAVTETKEIAAESAGKTYEILQQLCVDRGIPVSSLRKTTIEDMLDQYDKLVDLCISKKVVRTLATLGDNYRVDNTDVYNLNYRDMLVPVSIYAKDTGTMLGKYYVSYANDGVYLSNENRIAFKF